MINMRGHVLLCALHDQYGASISRCNINTQLWKHGSQTVCASRVWAADLGRAGAGKGVADWGRAGAGKGLADWGRAGAGRGVAEWGRIGSFVPARV